MENYEEKYNKAIERARKLATDLPNGRNDRLYHVDDLEYIFPELAESEDEVLRKELIRLLNKMADGIVENYTPIPLRDFVAWVEKQGEQKPAEWSEEDEAAYNKALDAYYYKDLNDKDDVVFALKSIIDLIAKHRKTIPVYQRWKPSEEQMKRLQCAIRILKDVNEHTDAKYLEELFNDLKKL